MSLDLLEAKRKIAEFISRRKVAALPATDDLDTLEKRLDPPCVYRLKEAGEVPCHCPKSGRKVMTYGCEVKGRCSTSGLYVPLDRRIALCRMCNERKTKRPKVGPLTWAIGVTTVTSRKETLLPHTLASLAKAGWENPRLFVDGGSYEDWRGCKYPLTLRNDNIRINGNWMLAAWELYIRNPHADRYLLVQDDVKFVLGLRDYLDVVPWPGRGYLNLYTHQKNAALANGRRGFYRANQQGLGALALVFNGDSITDILTAKHMAEKFRPNLPNGQPKQESWRSYKALDGGIVESFKATDVGGSEWVHSPSLVQHTGHTSTVGHRNPDSPTFPGDTFDARALLK